MAVHNQKFAPSAPLFSAPRHTKGAKPTGAVAAETTSPEAAHQLSRLAAEGLAQRHPGLSAQLAISHRPWAGLGLAALGVMVASAPFNGLAYGMGFVLSTSFLGMTDLRLLAASAPARPPSKVPALTDGQLPIYSVLVPLLRETRVLPQILGALMSLDYPREKLDIKLILEEGDTPMRQAVAALTLPPQISVVIVPQGVPQTKPRALNYALHFARGSLITIYDAEDVPEPQQLRLAAARFAAGPPRLACLQAELAFYNGTENWMARQFTIEYAIQFCLLLPALARAGWPLPLGGTSNHFRSGALRAAGGWDAFNVTEDADLGFRLARLGYQVDVLGSITYEEACIGLANWMRQRSRWLKGFLITWLVHSRRPVAALRALGPAGFLILQASLLGVVASALFYPEFLVLSLMKAPAASPAKPIWEALLDIYFLALMPVSWGVMFLAGWRALYHKRMHMLWPSLLFMPLYWLLISLAGHRALFEFLHAPFHWNKTRHGLSRLMRRGPAGPRPEG